MPSRAVNPATITLGAGGTGWTNPNNAKVEDGALAVSGTIGPGGGGGAVTQLQGTGLGFSLPTNAVIDGIQLDIKVGADTSATDDTGKVFLLYSGGSTSAANTPNIGQQWWNGGGGSVKWNTYGNSTSLWGRTWTPADINNSAFGASIAAFVPSGTAVLYVDAIQITVYYHLAVSTTPMDVPVREVYKVYNSQRVYLGNYPKPVEPFNFNQDINSLGSQVTIKIPKSIDTAASATEPYTTEDGASTYTDESGLVPYTTEGEVPLVSAAFQGINSLVKNGNIVEYWIYNYWYPNGKRMFTGKIRRWEADFDSDDAIEVILYSTSYDLDNYMTRGAPFTYTNDQVQSSQNGSVTVTATTGFAESWNKYGQTFIPTAANVGAITVKLKGTANVTVALYTAAIGGTLLASSTQSVNLAAATDVQFGFPNLVSDTPGNTYFFAVSVDPNQSILLYLQNTDVYAGGSAWNSNYSGAGGGTYSQMVNSDLYFIVSSGTGSTQATFSLKDPSTQMLKPIITDYNIQGGVLAWTAASVDATGLSLTYTFNVQTIYEALQAILSLAPNGFYYYIDFGEQIIYFKNQSTTADFLLQKGKHISALRLVTTTENSVNNVLFTGGEITPGNPLYKQYKNSASIAALGPLLHRKTDNRVTQSATADAIGVSELAEFSGEQYQTTVSLADTKYLDITLLVPGKTVGFRGFGTFVDSILAQIVRREWNPAGVTLTLGILPVRLSYEFNRTTRQLIAEQTQYNPSTPS
jgi:hypothetical protein